MPRRRILHPKDSSPLSLPAFCAPLNRLPHLHKNHSLQASKVRSNRERHIRNVSERLNCSEMVRAEVRIPDGIEFAVVLQIVENYKQTMADASANSAAASSPPSQPAGAVAVKPVQASAASSASKKGGAAKGGAKKARAKPSHPPTSEMVNNAVKALKERGGSSLQAIKKYIAASYKADTEKLSPFIKKYLKTAVSTGTLVQTKGKGASGSFKLKTKKVKAAPVATTTKAKKTVGAKKGVKKAVKPTGKKAAGAATSASGATKRSAPKERSKSAPPAKKAKKPAAEKPKKKAVGKPAAKAAKSPSKAKKATKPRAPKPKKTPTKAKPAAKKPAAQKKK